MEVVVGRLPAHWGFVACCGANDLVPALEKAAPSRAELITARRIGCVSPTLATAMETDSNAVDVNLAPEGSLLFEGDPIATIEGPLWQVWLVTHAVSNTLRALSTIATRAARLTIASGKGNVVDSTSILAPSATQAVRVARAAHVGGAAATQSPAAAAALGVELRLAPSSDAVVLSEETPESRGGVWAVQSSADNIVVHLGPGDDEEETLADLRRLGVGRGSFAARGLARDADGLELRADLVALEVQNVWTARMGVVPDPRVNPGRKLVVRYLDRTSRPIADVLHSVSERLQPAGEARIVGPHQGVALSAAVEGAVSAVPLLVTMLRSGRRVGADDAGDVSRRKLADGLEALPLPFKRLRHPARFPVGLSPSLAKIKAEIGQSAE